MAEPLPIERGSLRDLAYETLKRRIISAELAPGQRLFERDIAAELGVSRIPLREALRRLETDGLVLVVPGKGALVAPFTPADVRDLFDLRESLESLAARLAAERAGKEGLWLLRRRVREIEKATARADLSRIALANAAFHAEIVRLAANPLLTSLMRPVELRMQRLFHLTAERDIVEQCAEHGDLYEQIASGDGDKAADCALRHVADWREPSVTMALSWAVPDFDPDRVARARRRKRKQTP
ncbi:GntR family transcriptional regulator [Actinocorallia longicatena]|uniref:GntR family transcriptional regulator n=1 Tax=Actinocorallia longicatena TaxID=111803 RepID=A0ABP6Q972_9ACTN